jgi:hypothetical protein
MFGRLREGATHQMLVAELGTIARELREKHPEENGKKTEPRVFALEAELLGAFRQMLLIVLGPSPCFLAFAGSTSLAFSSSAAWSVAVNTPCAWRWARRAQRSCG